MYALPLNGKYAVKDQYIHDTDVLANVSRIAHAYPGMVENPIYTAIRKHSEVLTGCKPISSWPTITPTTCY